ncbi:MAG TPA: nucleotide pyrophosphohydrolase [Phycisphaerae bacterium]|nr:nucleotide pyrophosphohydrolase [Phycisphaerae bacterium]
MNDNQTTIADLKSMMTRFIAERNWEKFHTPRNLAVSLNVEAGELLELFQWLTPEEATVRTKESDFRTALGEEMADVLMYLVSLAVAADIDLAAATEGKMTKNCRKYPADEFRGRYQRPARHTD